MKTNRIMWEAISCFLPYLKLAFDIGQGNAPQIGNGHQLTIFLDRAHQSNDEIRVGQKIMIYSFSPSDRAQALPSSSSNFKHSERIFCKIRFTPSITTYFASKLLCLNLTYYLAILFYEIPREKKRAYSRHISCNSGKGFRRKEEPTVL